MRVALIVVPSNIPATPEVSVVGSCLFLFVFMCTPRVPYKRVFHTLPFTSGTGLSALYKDTRLSMHNSNSEGFNSLLSLDAIETKGR
jgi:hypothetical protein